MSDIVNINIECIYQHPDNPRKDLGDLSELAESIRKKGVMQNLTVIPGHWLTDEEWREESKKYAESPTEELRALLNERWTPEGYTLLIGHRRCEAAKLAGLKELPCKVVEGMSKKEQVSIMLEENMQRNDLTIWEQANGFQMMLDLGDTEDQIAEKTGFSRTTIRHRLNIAKLNQEELKKKEQDDSFQLALRDLYELEKVEDVKARNEILKNARSSREIAGMAQRAVADALREKRLNQLSEVLKAKGVKKAPKEAEMEIWSGKWETIREIDLDKEVPKRINLKDKDTLYWLLHYRSVRIIKKARKTKKELTPEELAQKERDRKKKMIRARMKDMSADRKEFIQNIISGKIDTPKEEDYIREMAWKFIVESGIYLSLYSVRKFFSGKDNYACSEEKRAEAQKKWDALSFTNSMLVALHVVAEEIGDTFDWQGHYKSEIGRKLIHAYEALKPYGWTFAKDDDWLLIIGKHELYAKEEPENEK